MGQEGRGRQPPWNRLPRELWQAIALGYLGGDLSPLVAPVPVCRRHLRLPIGRLERPGHRLVVALRSWSRVVRPRCRERVRRLALCRASGRCAGCGAAPASRDIYRRAVERFRPLYRAPIFACPRCRAPGSSRPHLELLTLAQARQRFGLSRAGLAAVRAAVPAAPWARSGILVRSAAVAALALTREGAS